MGDVTMRATFYGGPADGGELTLAEPIRTCLRFPLSPLEAIDLLEVRKGYNGLVPNVPAFYVLEQADGAPVRDSDGRIRYRYRVPNPAPKETPRD